MSISNSKIVEKIGLALLIIGCVFMILNDAWENNPIPRIMEKNMYFSSIGLLIWALANKNIRDKEEA